MLALNDNYGMVSNVAAFLENTETCRLLGLIAIEVFARGSVTSNSKNLFQLLANLSTANSRK